MKSISDYFRFDGYSGVDAIFVKEARFSLPINFRENDHRLPIGSGSPAQNRSGLDQLRQMRVRFPD